MEQQGTVNNRTFVLLNFPSIIVATPISIFLSICLSHPIPSYPPLSLPILPYPLLSYPIRSYPPLTYPILSYPTLSCPILSYPIRCILPYPILSFPVLSYPICPIYHIYLPNLSNLSVYLSIYLSS